MMLRRTLLAIGLFSSSIALATVQEHAFQITGNNGETGTGTFTWDDIVVPDGSQLNLSSNVLSIFIKISGGNVVGGTTTFTKTDCVGAELSLTPNFTEDINFWCNNGSNDLRGVDFYSNELNFGASTLTFSPGTTGLATPPQLSIESGYIKLDTIGDALPHIPHCDDPSHYGRMMYAELNSSLYICGPFGWKEFAPLLP
jgi:hypothetical protein